MNIFTKHEHIFGSPETEYLSRNLEEFFTLFNSLRLRLGGKAYLLNEYVQLILESTASQPLHATAEDVFREANELFRIVSAILAEKPYEHPLYDDCRQLILSHPLPCQESETHHICSRRITSKRIRSTSVTKPPPILSLRHLFVFLNIQR